MTARAGHTGLGTALADDEHATCHVRAALRCMLPLQSLLPNTQRISKKKKTSDVSHACAAPPHADSATTPNFTQRS